MAVGISVATSSRSFRLTQYAFLAPKPYSIATPTCLLSLPIRRRDSMLRFGRKTTKTVCFVVDEKLKTQVGNWDEEEEDAVTTTAEEKQKRISASRVEEKMSRKKSERFTYLVAAIVFSLGTTSMAVMAVYYRFSRQMEGGEVPIPFSEMFGTFALSVGAAVGMEFWARWAHRAVWHASLWHMHEGLEITVFGIAYMFIHDGLVHKRFAVGPIANLPYFRRVAAAHQIHHSDKFEGVPYGLFLGPKELEEVGGLEELEKEINRGIKLSNGS